MEISIPDVRIDEINFNDDECTYITLIGEEKASGSVFFIDVNKAVLSTILDKFFQGGKDDKTSEVPEAEAEKNASSCNASGK